MECRLRKMSKHDGQDVTILLLVKMKEKKLLKIRSLPKVLRAQAMRSTSLQQNKFMSHPICRSLKQDDFRYCQLTPYT